MEARELDGILRGHGEWLRRNPIRGNQADLRYADLNGADLSDAELAHADFTGAELQGADLSGADLELACLSNADLSGANLARANLSGADLSKADLTRADLSGANLTDAGLCRADLSGANLAHANLSGTDLDGADLTGTRLRTAKLWHALFEKVIVKGRPARGVISFLFARFRKPMPNPHMDAMRALLKDFTGKPSGPALATILRRHRGWIETGGARGHFADLSGRDLSSLHAENVNLSRANLRGANLAGAALSCSNLSGADLSGANMAAMNLRHTDLDGANLTGADLAQADLFNANLAETNLDGAIMDGTILGDNNWLELARRRRIIPETTPSFPPEIAVLNTVPPERIETSRLIVRRNVEGDAEAIFHEYAQDAEVTRYLIWSPHRDVAETRAFMQRCSEVWKAGTAFPYAIVRKDDNTLMGMIELRLDGHRAEFGYVLARPYWGNGFVPEALAAIMEWVSSQPRIHRVWAYCDVENRASQRVLEKAGMEREGVVRRWAPAPNVSDTPRDCYFYSLPGKG